MVAGALTGSRCDEHIRPIDVARDLDALANLIEICFRDELAVTRSNLVRDLRSMARWGLLLWLLQPFMDPLRGYVWVEDGRLVGNVTLAKRHDGIWNLSNVAVLPSYRGQGIAGHLVDAGIEYARRQGATTLTLEVRENNEVAQHIYRQRQFHRYDTVHEMLLFNDHWPRIVPDSAPVGSVRSARPADRQALQRLVSASTPPEARLVSPLARKRFGRGPLTRLGEFLGLMLSGSQTRELVAEEQGRLVAYLALEQKLTDEPAELSLVVHPQARGRWERSLLLIALWMLSRLSRGTTLCRVSRSHKAGVQALEELGFHTVRVLDQMALQL